ncbi:MAG: BlaI/MecI/CopY family transcriptional regulator [Bryobacteraceae bacterium]
MRPRSPASILTAQELEIMKIVWSLPASPTVRNVYEELLKNRKIAYTTVMTMMGILEQKGYLIREQGDRAYTYRPAQPRQKVVGAMVRDFLQRVFDGSAKPLLQHLVDDDRLSKQEIDEIAAIVNSTRRKRS